LRWSLTRLRATIDTADDRAIVADRENVELNHDRIAVDILSLRHAARAGVASLPIEALRAAAEALQGDFLEDLDLPDCEEFHSWCTAQREETRLFRARVLATLVERLQDARERVSHLVVYGGFPRGLRRRGTQKAIEQADLLTAVIRHGWANENPAYRQLFTSLFIPGASLEQMQWFNDLQRVTISPENALRIRDVFDEIDVAALLPQVSVPTLVLHCSDDEVVPFEEGRLIAANIPNVRFVALEGRNHLILKDDPARPRFLEEVTKFLRS
jgi:hypothetical protein